MKIAISAAGASLESPFEPRFGRAPGFVLVDSQSGAHTYLDNTPQQNLSQGAGIQTAQLLADQEVGALITGSVGPKAEQALAKSGIQIHTANASTVEEALASLRNPSNTTATGGGESPPRGSGGGEGRGIAGGGRGMGGGARGRGPGQGGRGMGGGAKGRGPGQGGRGMGGGGKGGSGGQGRP